MGNIFSFFSRIKNKNLTPQGAKTKTQKGKKGWKVRQTKELKGNAKLNKEIQVSY